MDTDLKLIKENYGEKMANFCCKYFSDILETKDLLPNLLFNNFEPNHSLYDDIIKQNKKKEFKDYIYSLTKDDEIETNKTPEELLSEIGYNLYECHIEKDIQSFKKYYAKYEKAGTFAKGILDYCHVFFAVKKDVDQIKREDYKTPDRQDKYATSVLSIQFKKDDCNTLSIKNRYNHSVADSDSTFSNNLDNITPGLTKSFEKGYGLKQKYKVKLKGYVKASDGKYYKYNQKINNIYYCPNNIIIDNYEVKRYDKEKYIVMDYFILDLVNKTIKTYNSKDTDSFVDTIKDIEKIEVKKVEKDKIVIIKVKGGIDVKIVLNEYNQIIKLENYNVKKVNDYFLYCNNSLQELIIPNLQVAGDSFLYSNNSLKSLNLSHLQKVGNRFLYCNNSLQHLTLPNLQFVNHDFLHLNNSLKSINLAILQVVGDNFLFCNNTLQVLILPSLQVAGEAFLHFNNSLQFIYAPNLEKDKIGKYFLSFHPKINIDNFKDNEINKPNKKVRERIL